jgi:predicted amidohydrolase
MKPVLLFLAIAAWLPAQVPFRQAAFGEQHGWTLWAPREEITPRAFIDAGSLALSGRNNAAEFGGWERAISGIQPEAWYRFRATWRGEELDFPARQVVPRLDWTDERGRRVGQPEYPWATTAEAGWNTVALSAQAPPRAAGVKIQLLLVNAPRATVWWKEIALEPSTAPVPRRVTVASVNLYPRKTADPVGDFLALLERDLPAKTDLVVLPEGITQVGSGKTYAQVAEPVPGPTTARLGEFAKRKKTWIAAGLYERENRAIYNTAVLIDREGRLAGRYRKIYIPREEYEAGLTPGSDFPVFRTDFGTVGMMICWDSQYPDPARGLALRGAEMILMPIWGGNETLSKARTIENHVFLVASGYDHPTFILDPNGEALSRAPERGTLAIATIDLSRRYADAWLGDMRARFMKESRFDVAVDPPGRR